MFSTQQLTLYRLLKISEIHQADKCCFYCIAHPYWLTSHSYINFTFKLIFSADFLIGERYYSVTGVAVQCIDPLDHSLYNSLFKSLIYNTELRVIRFVNQKIDYNKKK